MAQVTIPLGSDIYRGLNDVQLSDRQTLLIDGYLDRIEGESDPASIKRPGLLSFTTIGSTSAAIDGCYWWNTLRCAIAVCDGKVFKVTYPGNTPLVTELTGARLLNGSRVKFTTDGTYLFMANGGRIVYTDGTAVTNYLGDIDAPTRVTDIDYLDGYILATNSDNKFYWADLSSSLSWNALSFASAVANPDLLTGLKVLSREIFLFGENSIEIWENDGSTPFSRVPGGAIQTGCIAPNSVTVTEDGIYWLDDKKHFLVFEGRSPRSFSTPYDTEISGYSTVSDCIGDRIEINGKPFLVFHFPQANQTLVYSMRSVSWSKFGYWTGSDLVHQRWLGNCYCFAPDWNLHLVGSRLSNTLYTMSSSYYTDNGTEIRYCRRTGHISYGTTKEKVSKEIRLRMQRGQVSLTTNPQAMIRWRDNNRDWSEEHYLGLGGLGEYDIVSRLFRTGRYRTRQYELCHTDASPFMYLDGQEEVEVVR